MGWPAGALGAQDAGMSTDALGIYRRFQSYLLNGEFGRLGEVVDIGCPADATRM